MTLSSQEFSLASCIYFDPEFLALKRQRVFRSWLAATTARRGISITPAGTAARLLAPHLR